MLFKDFLFMKNHNLNNLLLLKLEWILRLWSKNDM